MSTLPAKRAEVVTECFDSPLSACEAAVIFSNTTGGVVLESSLPDSTYGRFSIMAFDPIEIFTAHGGVCPCPFQALAERAAAYPVVREAPSLPFAGGWIGFFAYEAGHGLERIRHARAGAADMPLARFGLYDSAAIFDHQSGAWTLMAVDWPSGSSPRRSPAAVRLAALRSQLEKARGALPDEGTPAIDRSAMRSNMSRHAYLAKVEKVKRYIEAGDVYQVNLTQRFSANVGSSPGELYRCLRRFNPSPYSAFLHWDDKAILSSSPELFLELRGGCVLTRPIKGTRPRAGDPEIDAAYRRALCASEKDRAELNMIVDLLRNDLGRVCEFGTIRVDCAGEIEEHPTVFHRTATIRGRLDSGRTWVDLLRATFPGGSVTGVPKIRAMQIIGELEPTERGVYCGSIGTIGLDGSLSLNIAIRTMVQVGSVVHLYVGGAIVADSTPEDEYDETMAKAAGMLRALGCEVSRGSSLTEELIPA